MGNVRKMRPGASGHGKRISEEEREALRQRRRAYYESLSPEEKRAFQERRRRRKRIQKLRKMALSGGIMLALVIISVIGTLIQHRGKKRSGGTTVSGTPAATQDFGGTQLSGPVTAPDWVTQSLIRVNEYSRPGTKLEQVNGIVVHYVGNVGTTAENNRNYFDSLADTGETSASSHFIIGLEGEILQCVPMDEIAYASNERNQDTISIECCHPGADGKFTDATYDSLVKLVKWLEETYHLQPESVIRHYDVTGKECPKYFVEHEDAWKQFRRDIALE